MTGRSRACSRARSPPPSARQKPFGTAPPPPRGQRRCHRMCKYTWPGSNWRPSACEADVIATRPQVHMGDTCGNSHPKQSMHCGSNFHSSSPHCARVGSPCLATRPWRQAASLLQTAAQRSVAWRTPEGEPQGCGRPAMPIKGDSDARAAGGVGGGDAAQHQ